MIASVSLQPTLSHSHPWTQKICVVTQKIAAIAKAFFSTLGQLLVFPLRYFGAKDWSLVGTLLPIDARAWFEKEKMLTKEEAKKLLVYPAACAGAHNQSQQWVEPFGYKDVPTFTHLSKSPLGISVFQKENEVIIAFSSIKTAGISALKEPLMQAVLANCLGIIPKLYVDACEETKKILESRQIKGKKVTLTGHCSGGSMASYVGLKLSVPTVTVNSFPLGAGLQWDLGREKLQNAHRFVHHVFAEKEWTNGTPILNLLNRIFSFVSLRLPGNFGKKSLVVSAYKDSANRHIYILGSFMHHIGFSARTYPWKLPKEVVQ